MPDNKRVKFNEPQVLRQRIPNQSWPTKLIIKSGLAKDEKQASIVLVAIGVFALIVMVLFWPRSGHTPAAPLPTTTTNSAGAVR